jgi:hypothetical protein
MKKDSTIRINGTTSEPTYHRAKEERRTMRATREITNTEDILDTRDILERINYLDETEDAAQQEELQTLQALIEEVRQVSGEEPEYGATLIRDSYFVDYARELAEDGGLLDPSLGWRFMFIGWAAAAEHLKLDYSPVDFDGETYWVQM